MKVTQCERILDYIRQFGSISTLEGFTDLGVARLGSRIHDLKCRGYDIRSETVSSLNRFGEKTYYKKYTLVEKGEG